MKQLEKEKIINKAAKEYAKFMDVLLPDWKEDKNMVDTPMRVSRAFVEDIFSGLYDDNFKITAFPNDGYDGLVMQCNIPVKSICSHHHQIIDGIAHVAYIPGDTVIGLSKLNRTVDYFARRPQLQETLTIQIHDFISNICIGNAGVAVIIKAKHACCSHRGIKHDSDMQTIKISGAFKDDSKVREEFYSLIQNTKR